MMPALPGDWQGPTPWYLVIQTQDGTTVVDLDEHQWATTHADLMREPGTWVLMNKAGQFPPLMVIIHPGEQPYYTARHVGVTSSGGGNEVTAYGIGKKLADGSVNRIWIMPNGIICSGDDVDDIGIKMVHALGPSRTM